MNYEINRSRLYLKHHGVLGQKWGRQNGPPYPLDGPDHSSSEKKAGWKKSLGGGRNESEYGRTNKDRTKTFVELNKAKAHKTLNKDAGNGKSTARNIVEKNISVDTIKKVSDLRREMERNEDVSDDDEFVMEVFNKFDPDDPKYEEKVINALNHEQSIRNVKYQKAKRAYMNECQKITDDILGDYGNKKLSDGTTYNDLLKKNVDFDEMFEEATLLYQIYEDYY